MNDPILDTIKRDGCIDKSNIMAAIAEADSHKCPKCGTNGDHYCPADVDRGDTETEDAGEWKPKTEGR